MALMDYSKLALNTNADDSESTALRVPHTAILIEALKLLDDKGDSTYEPCRALLAHSYWHWLPDYFFSAPASSTGKYHPAFANGPRGLMLHSLAVARIADLLFKFYACRDADTKNLLISAAWLHDMLKYGDPNKYISGKYTVHEHPVLAAEFLSDPVTMAKCRQFGLEDSQIGLVSDLIRTHMGPYVKNKYSDIILDAPGNDLQQLLFTADLIASRKENDIVKDVMT